MAVPDDIVEQYLAAAEVVAAAVASPEVAAAWDGASVLEEQTVGSLAGHLARGGVWLVGDYLDDGQPEGPGDLDGAADYFATFADSVTADAHQAIRDRGAEVAAVGRDALVGEVRARLDALAPRLRAEEPSRLVRVARGWVLPLDEYLATRLVEQAVHLDDLARSVGREPWPLPDATTDLVCAIGLEVAQRRFGGTAVLRALYRQGFAEGALPVV